MLITMMRILSVATLLVALWSLALGISLQAAKANVVALVGGNVTLECVVSGLASGASPPYFLWISPQTDIIDTRPEWHAEFGVGRRYTFTDGGLKLTIRRITPDDHGEYTCQLKQDESVSGSSSVTAQVTLTVYKAPEDIDIEGVAPIKEDPRNPQILVIPFNEPTAVLRCKVFKSSPAIGVKWFREGVEVTTGITVLDPLIDAVDKSRTSISELTIDQPSQAVDGQKYRCMADLEALNSLEGINVSLEDDEITLSVQYPPNNLNIIGYTNGSIVNSGDRVLLTCRSSGGNPLPALTWSRDGTGVMYTFETEEATQTVSNTLTIDASAAENNVEYSCMAESVALDSPLTRKVVMKVRFAPETLTITGHENIDAGKQATLSCTSSRSNPISVLTWDIRGKSFTPYSTVLDQGDGSWITQSNITFSVDENDNQLQVICQALTDGVQQTVISTVDLSVNYPPYKINITTDMDSSVAVEVETEQQLTCSTYGGNPAPTLTWFYDNQELDASSGVQDPVNYSEGRYHSRALLVTVKPKHNGQAFKCKASSSVAGKWQDQETSHVMAVYFRAVNVEVTTNEASTVLIAGTPITLKCASGSSNPASQITWYKANEEMIGDGITIDTVDPVDSQFNGKSRESRLTFTPQVSDYGLHMECTARNDVIRKSTTSRLLLDVQYKPQLTKGPSAISIAEGSNGTYDFTATANPEVTGYTWFKVDSEGVETQLTFTAKRDTAVPEISVADGVLSLTHVKRDKASNYKVKAENAQGNSEKSFSINVEYKPGAMSVTQVQSNGDVVLTCTIDSNPPPTKVEFSRPDYEFVEGKHAQAVSTDAVSGHIYKWSLSISGVIKADIGEYTCTAENVHGSESVKYSVTPFDFAPEMKTDVTKAAAQTGTAGTIICEMESYPQPTVTWTKGGASLSNGDKYSFSIATLAGSTYHHQATLIVNDVGEADYGEYTCTANNARGTSQHSVTLGGTSQPDPPSDVQVQNSSDTSVVLNWKPGFDGGLGQTFRVRYYTDQQGAANSFYADSPGTPYHLTGLKPSTQYTVSVRSRNELGDSRSESAAIQFTTLATPTSKPFFEDPENKPMLIVMLSLVVVGVLLLILAAVLVTIFVRRRRRQQKSEATDSTSQTNTVEMYGTQDEFVDDAKSYSTYEKHLDEDYKHYDEDEDYNSVVKSKTSHRSNHANEPNSPTQPIPWTKSEDPSGHSGHYIRHPSQPTASEDFYRNQIRNQLSKVSVPNGATYTRPDFARDRPPAPKPPVRSPTVMSYDSHPTVPERNYSPFNPNIPPQPMEMHLQPVYGYQKAYDNMYPSYSNSSHSESDDQRGHLV